MNRPIPVVVAIATALFAVHARRYSTFVVDDAFISLRYAQRLLDGYGLTFTDGPRVEGYSNLLWVLACAALGSVGIDLVISARLLGHVAAIIAIVALALVFTDLKKHGVLPALASSLFLGSSGTFAVWAYGGLETNLVAACLACGLLLVVRNINRGHTERLAKKSDWILASVPFAFLCLTRPDGALVAGCFASGLLASGVMSPKDDSYRHNRRVWLAIAAWFLFLPVMFVSAQIVFRLAYYAAWIPNTAHVRIAFTLQRAEYGVHYVFSWMFHNKSLVALALAGIFALVRDPNARQRLIVLLPLCIVWPAYTIVIGGDTFAGRRQMVIPLVMAVYFAAEGVCWLVNRGTVARKLAAGGVMACAVVFLYDQLVDVGNTRALDYRWPWESLATGDFYRRHFASRNPLLAVSAAGALPYSSKFNTLDMLGLNDRHIATHKPPGFGKGKPAHDTGDPAYVLDKMPDIIVLGTDGKAHFESGVEMQSMPGFINQYSLVKFEIGGRALVGSTAWIRRNSERLGVQFHQDGIIIPGFFFGTGNAVACEDAHGRLGATISAGSPGSAVVRELYPGSWELAIQGSSEEVLSTVQSTCAKTEIASTFRTPYVFQVTAPGPCDITIVLRPSGPDQCHIRKVVLTRMPIAPTTTRQLPL